MSIVILESGDGGTIHIFVILSHSTSYN